MKAKLLSLVVPALFLATAAVAQPTDKSTTREPSVNPNPNASSDAPRSTPDAKSDDKMHAPSAQDRAKNREAVSDATITGKVKTALATDVGLKTVTNINVDTDNSGVVTLTGKVNSADQKKRAEQVAKKVSGVKSVKNQLTVSGG